MDEEKYTPNFSKMEIGEIQGSAKAAQNMADRRFQNFEGDIQEIIEAEMFDKDNYQLVKDLKKDVEENNFNYEEILKHLVGVYFVNPEKYVDQLKELTGNFEVMASRRYTVRTKGKEAITAIEDEKNKQEQRISREDRTVTGSHRGGGKEGEKQLKQPMGAHPEKISSEFTLLWRRIGPGTSAFT